MTIEPSKEDRSQAIAPIERWFKQNRRGDDDQPIDNVAAAGLLSVFVEDIGPSVCNRAVAVAHERLQQQVAELDFEGHDDDFGYWHPCDKVSTRSQG